MGGPAYSDESYTSFSRSIAFESRDRIFSQREMHPDMNPHGLNIREARDSDVHPNSVPIIVALDVTGSMGYIPEDLIKNGLNHLVKNIIDAGIPSPAICFIAVGDHISDYGPLQVGQFESGDQELILWLKNTWIEENGGGGCTESYPLAWLFASKHTVTDNWEKRGKKGFLFTIGDEQAHKIYKGDALKKIMGYSQGENYTDEELLKLAQEQWNVYHIHANDASYPVDRTKDYWKPLLGDNFIVAQDHKDIPALMASIIVAGFDSEVPNLEHSTEPTNEEEKEGNNPSTSML